MRAVDLGKRVVPGVTIMEGQDGSSEGPVSTDADRARRAELAVVRLSAALKAERERADRLERQFNDALEAQVAKGRLGPAAVCAKPGCGLSEEEHELPADLDPGVRDLVIALNAAGFETTDSGDGKSKFVAAAPGEEIIPFPHVAIRVRSNDLVKEADRLSAWMIDQGMPVDQQGIRWHWYIEASYDPFVEDGMIFIGKPE